MLKRIYGTNICIECQKACGGCSWSKSFEPIEGWTAKKCHLPMVGRNSVTYIETYYITACPEFEQDGRKVVDIDEEMQLA